MAISDEFRGHLQRILKGDEYLAGKLAWRMSCFDQGAGYAGFVESEYFRLEGKRVLDAACAWGGHLLAFQDAGAEVVGSDLDDFEFAALSGVAEPSGTRKSLVRASCLQLPFEDNSFDVVMGLELVEHIPAVEPFAREVARVLRPGGIGIVSTPSKWTAIFWGEPHYQLRGIALLPFALQGPVARGIFGRRYPYPIERQYASSAGVLKPFLEAGLSGEAVVLPGRVQRLMGRLPGGAALLRTMAWSLVVVQKPAIESGARKEREAALG